MIRTHPWSTQKRTGAVKNRIRQDYRNFLSLIINDDTRKSISYDFGKDFVDSNTGDPIFMRNKHDLPHNHEKNTLKYSDSQGSASTTERHGSVEQKCEEVELNEISFYSIPLSDSEDEEDEKNYNEYTRNIELCKKLKKWSIGNNISQTALKELLLILNESYGSTLSLPKDPRTILQTPKQVHIKNIEDGQYWHHGIINPLTKLLISCASIPNIIYLNFNFDGLPIFKSAKKEFWPILADVFEVDKDPFIIGIYYGTGKPKNLNAYLEDFVNEMKSLLDNGICINEKNVSVKIRCFVCDSPARAFIKGVCNFNGKHGCLKCTTVGEYSHVSHTVVFSTKKDTQRTDENFRARKYGSHHKGDSPLLSLSIDMVEDFPVADSLHLIDLGIMKRLLIGWRDGNFGTYVSKLCARDIENLDVFLRNCTLPTEIHRAVRGVDCLAYWKASEFRTFFHYLSVVILPDILRGDVVEHFLSIFCSITICSTQSYRSLLPFAREMIEHFVERYKYLYGIHYITSNVHNLLHVVDEVEKFGPLHTFNAYPFENQLYLMKRMLRQGDKPLAQIAKRLCEKGSGNPPETTKSTNNSVIYLKTRRNMKILHFENFILSSRAKDKYFMTHSNDIFEFKDSVDEKVITLFAQKIMNIKDVIFHMPIRSSYLNMYKIKEPYVLSDYIVIRPDEIKCKLVCVSHKNMSYFLPLLHTLCK